MSLHLEMLQVARLAPRVLGESTSLVRRFFEEHQGEEGGFQDRDGDTDLYYTVFGVDGLMALCPDEEAIRANADRWSRAGAFLQACPPIEALDLVHLGCLSRTRAALRRAGLDLEDQAFANGGARIRKRLDFFRAAHHGYHVMPDSQHGSAYGCFMVTGICQDWGLAVPDPQGICRCLDVIRTEDGAWANDPSVEEGSTNATAAALTVLRQLRQPAPPEAVAWLKGRLHGQGGFTAAPRAPMPDLLSTATALHALSGAGESLAFCREACLDLVDSLWTNEGAFHGHWADEFPDVEYTFYGLLALGHLSA